MLLNNLFYFINFFNYFFNYLLLKLLLILFLNKSSKCSKMHVEIWLDPFYWNIRDSTDKRDLKQ